MPKFLKSGKVVLLLNGRHAGKKAVVLRNFDEGSSHRKYGHALVAGVEKYPLRVTSSMGKRKVARRSRIKPFIKLVNYNHVMPTRYGLDIDFKNAATPELLADKDTTKRADARKKIRKLFEDRYKSGKNRWFFTKLRF